MARKAIHAAGGIAVRGGARPLVAVVQRSKDERWVLPRGKLKRDENPRAAARREVVEETGHRVHVHEFLGAIGYTVRGQPKVVQFWRMQAAAQPSREITKDIIAVDWLPLAAAARRLSFALEKLFLLGVGRRVLKRRRRGARRKAKTRRRDTGKARTRKRRSQPRKPRPAHLPAARGPAARTQRRGMLARMLGRLRR